MSNVIQIKHGSKAPGKGVLAPYELGYAIDEGVLYIGNNVSNTIPLNYLPLSGGTISGPMTFEQGVIFNQGISVSQASDFNGQTKFNNILIVDSNSFGPTLPSSGVIGQLFFKTT